MVGTHENQVHRPRVEVNVRGLSWGHWESLRTPIQRPAWGSERPQSPVQTLPIIISSAQVGSWIMDQTDFSFFTRPRGWRKMGGPGATWY